MIDPFPCTCQYDNKGRKVDDNPDCPRRLQKAAEEMDYLLVPKEPEKRMWRCDWYGLTTKPLCSRDHRGCGWVLIVEDQ